MRRGQIWERELGRGPTFSGLVWLGARWTSLIWHRGLVWTRLMGTELLATGAVAQLLRPQTGTLAQGGMGRRVVK